MIAANRTVIVINFVFICVPFHLLKKKVFCVIYKYSGVDTAKSYIKMGNKQKKPCRFLSARLFLNKFINNYLAC